MLHDRASHSHLSSSEMCGRHVLVRYLPAFQPSARFWISGVSKAVATLLTYPLIRAKACFHSFVLTCVAPACPCMEAVIQTTGGDHLGLWGMLARSLHSCHKDRWHGVLDGPGPDRRTKWLAGALPRRQCLGIARRKATHSISVLDEVWIMSYKTVLFNSLMMAARAASGKCRLAACFLAMSMLQACSLWKGTQTESFSGTDAA